MDTTTADTMTAGRWELAPLPDDDAPADAPEAGSGPEDGDGYLTTVQAADRLRDLEQALAAREKLQARIVGLLDELVRSKRIEQLEGLTPEMWLRIAQRQSGLDCWLLLTAVAVLGRMPVTWGLFRRGVLSWSQICRIVSRVRDLPCDGQKTIDARIGASADLLDALGVDGLEAAVDRAARDVEGPARAERDEARARSDGFVHVQAKLFGGIKLYGEYDDPVEAATIVNGLDAAAEAAQRDARTDDDHDHHHDDGGDGHGGWRDGRTRSFWRSRGLLAMCQHALAGHNDSDDGCDGVGSRRAKPTVIVHIDVADTTATCAGQVELNVTGGGLPAVTKRRLEDILGSDHDLRVVLFDDGRPLAVSDLVHADDIPTRTRIAVKARDRGCRFDGKVPAGKVHIHHIDGRGPDGGGHHPDRLVSLGGWAHLRGIHRYGWRPTPTSGGIVVWRRGTRTFRTAPWGTPLRRIPPDPDDHDPGGPDP